MFRQRIRVQTNCSGESKTKQSHRDSTDINNIIAQFDRTGQLPQARRQGYYGDVSGMNDDLGVLMQQSQETLDAAGKYVADKQKQEAATPPVTDQPASDSAQIPAEKPE